MPDEPGWYPDPYFKGWQRFWDGAQWTRQSRRETLRSGSETHASPALVGVTTGAASESPVPTAVVPRTPLQRTATAAVLREPPVIRQVRRSSTDDQSGRSRLFRNPRYLAAGLAAAIVVLIIVLAVPKSHSPTTPSGTNGGGASGRISGHHANANTPAASAAAAIPTPTTPSQFVAAPGQITPTTSPFSGSTQTLTTDQTGQVADQGHPVARLKVTAETLSSSVSNGVRPKNGYFVTFTVKIKDVSTSETYNVSPLDFYVSTPSDQHFNSDDGQGSTANNVSGALQSENLNPGEAVTGTVTIDEPSPHGTFVYAISAVPLDSWSF